MSSCNLMEELKVPKAYIKELDKSDRFLVIVHQTWLRALIKNGTLNDFIRHATLSSSEIQAKLKLNETLGSSWRRILVCVLPKSEKRVVPLPRQRTQLQSSEEDLSYSQILQYISLTNHKNLWKESLKKYANRYIPQTSAKENASCISLIQHDIAVRDIITRIYGCSIIRLYGSSSSASSNTLTYEPHPNVLPACAVVETNSYFYVIQETNLFYTLQDCVNFSSTILGENYYKPMFIAYQLLGVMKDMHDKGLAIGDITLSDILISPKLWIQVIPRLSDNIYDPPKLTNNNDRNSREQIIGKRTPTTNSESFKFNHQDKLDLDIGHYCEQWVQGVISNFDYLIVLNKLAGRKYADPQSHYVFPWVSDFMSRSGLNWRDLTRSKFRLNKGDRQLDLTYEVSSNHAGQIPHHVSDILSEITYYVYLARITPKSILCKYVRPQWVPAEYPISIQRLQQWTPDECIPEFFADASVFKSVHPDLPDLEVPSWANSAQDFVNCHRAALESTYVSERLHHWIDLTFGYKLSGVAAVKAKNICLQLVDSHTNLTSSGIMQLFTHPHPQKFIPSPYLSKTPPRVFKPKAYIDEEDHSSGPEESEGQVPPGLAVSKFLSRSRNSLNYISPASNDGITLHLPQGYNPLQSLIAYENTYNFIAKTSNKSKINLQNIRVETEKNFSTQYKQVVATRRAQEMLVFGCVLVELFMPSKLRAVGSNLQVPSFKRRLENCRALLCSKRDEIPKCIRSVVTLLLQTDNISGLQTSAGIRTYPVTDFGIPPPSAHQLLLSNLSSHLLPLPASFPCLYVSLKTFQDFLILEEELKYTKIDSNQSNSSFNDAIIMISKRIHESKVTELAKSLHTLDKSEKANVLTNLKWMDFILPLLLEMLENRKTDVNAAWHLFEPASRILGPETSVKTLLKPIMKLYEYEFKDEDTSSELEEVKTDDSKRIKLYHRSFLLRLIVGFGMKNFLEHIITFLIEAVGGYQDTEDHKVKSNVNPVQRLKEVNYGFLGLPENEVADEITIKSIPTLMVVEPQGPGMDEIVASAPPMEVEDVDSDADNLTSLHEVLLDEQEVASDDDTEFLNNNNNNNNNCNNTYVELMPTYENVTKDMFNNKQQNQPAAEKGINDLCKIAEVSADSVIWLAHRLGPSLTAKYLTKNLLRMLTLCYSGDLFADEKATHLINCLINIAGIYGEQFVVLQYIPQISDLILACKRSRMTQALEAGLIGYMSLFKYLITFLSTNTLKELMHDSLTKSVLHPAIRLMASTKILFSSGSAARSLLASKLIDCLYILGMRLGHLISRSLQRFFVTFDKLRLSDNTDLSDPLKNAKPSNVCTSESDKAMNSDSADSPNPSSPVMLQEQDKEQFKIKVMEELCNVLTPELAYEAYSVFARYFGESFMQRSLINLEFIQELGALYKEERQLSCNSKSDIKEGIKALEEFDKSHATVSGNKIHFADSNGEPTDECREMYDESRHLRGNWLAYWEHELRRSATDKGFNFKQIKLQGFVGHTNTVKSLQILDNENSFMSASRDKTVKLWSLRSQGDGSATSQCQYTYTNHHKSVLSLGFCERTRLVASCDSVIHLWDPFIGRLVSVAKNGYPVNALVPLPSPNASIIAANTHASLNILDTRTANYVSELKVCINPSGLIRSIAVPRSSNWVAIGQSSGAMAVIDLRTGNILSSWKGHEGEVLQLIAADEHTLITSSLDQSISVWNVLDGKLNFTMKSPVEPVHCLAQYEEELISGTTANRIGVHTSISHDASFSSTKLRSDSFKGVLTTISILPLNRLLLLGADTGYITLIC